MDRRDFLKLGATGLMGVILSACSRKTSEGTWLSAIDLGIKPKNTATANRKKLIKALTGSSRNIRFPAGHYLLDNGGSEYIKIHDFSGKLKFDAGSRWVFTDSTRRGVLFQGGSGTAIHGMSVTYRSVPVQRHNSQAAVAFYGSTDTAVDSFSCDRSPATGLYFGECVSPRIQKARIRNTMADGLHFSNCSDARVLDLEIQDTGDDGLAFVNYSSRADLVGGTARKVYVKNSGARGISVIGQRSVFIDDFAVEGSKGSGIICAYERSYNTRIPRDVHFRNGKIRDAGRHLDNGANPDGIALFNPNGPNGENGWFSAEFENIEVYTPYRHGVYGVIPNGTARLSNVMVGGVPGKGLSLDGGELDLDHLKVENSGGSGIQVGNAPSVVFGNIIVLNACKSETGAPAVLFYDNGQITGETLDIVETQPTVAGRAFSATDVNGDQHGKIEKLRHHTRGGKIEVINDTSGLKISKTEEIEL